MSLKPNEKSIKYSIGEYQYLNENFVEKHTNRNSYYVLLFFRWKCDSNDE